VLADRVATGLREVSSNKAYLDNSEDTLFATLYYSLASHVLTDSVYQGENRYRSSFEGAYKALIEEHVPLDIVGAEELTSDRIAKYKVLVVLDAVAMSDESPLNYDTSFIKPESNSICERIDLRENIPHRHGQQIKTLPRPDAESAAKLMLPATEIIPGDPRLEVRQRRRPG
jgi:hypothetical protein